MGISVCEGSTIIPPQKYSEIPFTTLLFAA
nr:hypothetical protein RKHAN_01534 [Rhizobium sp. Khangiran2]